MLPKPLQLSSMDPQAPSDAELVNQLQAGQTSALALIYDRYASLVYGLALRMLKDTQGAEDLTQEIFITLWRQARYNPERGSLARFLMVMTRSRAIDKLRVRSINLDFCDRSTHPVAGNAPFTPFEQVSLEERSQQVRLALEQLSDYQRQVLEMAYYDGFSQSEIAQQLDIPLGTVKTRTRQGLLKLQRLLKDWMH